MGILEDLKAVASDRRVTPPDDPETEKQGPNLWELLTQDRWGDGSERVLPTLTISRVPGGYRVVYTDDSLWIKKSVVISRLNELVSVLEASLVDDSPWEAMKKSYRNKKGPPIPEEKPTRRKRG